MSEQNERKVPTLTLTPSDDGKMQLEQAVQQLEGLEQAAKENPVAPDAQKAIAMQFDYQFTEEEQKAVEEFAEKIDLEDPNHVMLYGADAQKKVSDFADNILTGIKNKDAGDVGDMLSGLIGELKTFEGAAAEPKGLRRLFFSAEKHVEGLRSKFDAVNKNVENIASTLEGHQVQLLKDVAMLNHLYDMNLDYFKELTMYIAAGEKRLAKVRETDLVTMREKAKETGDAMDAQKAGDLDAACDRFEKKLHDLKLTRQISLQMAPQIRLLQNNNSLLVERIQSTLVNTLPLWKNQMVLALGLQHTQQAVRAQRAVTDMTNDLLKKNAEKLKMGTIETARESERSIVDMATLIETNQSLIDTMNEVVRIQSEGHQKRMEAEKTLIEMENELKNRLING